MKKLILILLISLGISLLFTQCAMKGESVGDEDKIFVFADSLDWVNYKDALNTVLGRPYKTPVLEREYLLEWIPFRHFNKFKKYKNILLIGRLDSNEPVSTVVQNILNPEIEAGIRSGKYFYIPKNDVWAIDQYVLILVATGQSDMIQKIHDLGDLIYADFRSYYFNRLKKRMFKHMEQVELEKYIEKHFPFTIRVQHDYFVADENFEKNYLWLRRLSPDRSILIHWISNPDTVKLTPRWVIEERNKITRKLYQGDVVVEEETTAKQTQFLEQPAIRLEGTWRNDSLMVGGPFRSITFKDPESGRIYMLDYYVQAVGKRKKPYLDQCEVIIRTFRPK
ncbi:MAG: hypothetical protein Kow0037_09010 [Calditrichia bacterium]